MRLILFFDLPTLTSEDRRNYRHFRKNLITSGFIMMQESVYSRISIDLKSAKLTEERVRKFCPPVGLIQTIIITEKQFATMDYLIGKQPDQVAFTPDRLVII